jgi:hypothetical protein
MVFGLAAGCGGTTGGTATDDGAEASITLTAGETGGSTQDTLPDPTATSASGTAAEGDTTAVADDTGVPKFDVGDPADMGTQRPIDLCHVNDEMDAVGDCEMSAPADSFEPEIQWTFGANEMSWVTPLVGNFTDDNGDGEIDLCDTPDVVFVGGLTFGYGAVCEIHMLDGATGGAALRDPVDGEGVVPGHYPAFGDIDSDGLPEIVAVWNHDGVYRIKAFEHDGTVKWANQIDGGTAHQFARESGAIALHDLDADGDVEIVFNHEVYDHNGNLLLWEHPSTRWPRRGRVRATAVDLDGDGMLEVVTGHAAYTCRRHGVL